MDNNKNTNIINDEENNLSEKMNCDNNRKENYDIININEIESEKGSEENNNKNINKGLDNIILNKKYKSKNEINEKYQEQIKINEDKVKIEDINETNKNYINNELPNKINILS